MAGEGRSKEWQFPFLNNCTEKQSVEKEKHQPKKQPILNKNKRTTQETTETMMTNINFVKPLG